MRIIKVIYDGGNNGLVKVARLAKKNGKRLCEMSSAEIMNCCFGLARQVLFCRVENKMETKLFDALVMAICNGDTGEAMLKEILLDEVYDLDDEISEADALKLVDKFIDDHYIEADDVAHRMNEEAIAYLNEREFASRGW